MIVEYTNRGLFKSVMHGALTYIEVPHDVTDTCNSSIGSTETPHDVAVRGLTISSLVRCADLRIPYRKGLRCATRKRNDFQSLRILPRRDVEN